MKTVAQIAELISRGLEEDQAAQEAVMKIMKRAESDPEIEQSIRDAAARVKEGRIQRDKKRETPQVAREVEDEADGKPQPSEREAKLLRLLMEARMKIKEMGGAEEGVRAGEAGAQNARVPQGQQGAQAGALQGREGGPRQ